MDQQRKSRTGSPSGEPPEGPPGRLLPPPPPLSGQSASADSKQQQERSVRPSSRNGVRLIFRAPCQQFRLLLGQLIQLGSINKNECYNPNILHLWTVKMSTRLKSDVPMAAAMRAVIHRLGLHSGPVAFCLDGFYDVAEEFGNIFGTDVAPWMLIQSSSTPASLSLQDGDSIFLSMKMRW